MKRSYKHIPLFALFICLLMLVNCSGNKKAADRYPYKSGKIVYENTVQQTTIQQTMFFEDYGESEAITSSINMKGDEVVMKSIYKGGFCYTSASTSDQVGKTKIDRNKINHLGFFTITFKMLSDESAIMEGQELINGQICDIYTIKKKDYDMQLWVWENVIMKMISRYRGTIMTRTVIEIEEIKDLPKSIFEVEKE